MQKKKKREREIPAWWWAIEQLIVSWEIKTPAKERSRNSLLVIGFLLRRWLAWSFFSKKKKKSLLKGNKGVRRHKGRLSTFHWADKRKKSQLRLITTKVMKETEGDRKERKSLLFLTWEKVDRSTVSPQNSILWRETGGGRGWGWFDGRGGD